MFIQTFGAQVDRCCQDDSERQSFLRTCLSTDIQMQLGECLLHPRSYERCLQELHQKFGNPRVIATDCSRALLELVPFHEFLQLSSVPRPAHRKIKARWLRSRDFLHPPGRRHFTGRRKTVIKRNIQEERLQGSPKVFGVSSLVCRDAPFWRLWCGVTKPCYTGSRRQ
jgi:hypothetical protein